MTATTSAAPSPPLVQSRFAVKPNVYIGTLGVFLGAGTATLSARLVGVGLPDLRGALGFGVDEAAWIPTAYDMAQMFMGPFSVYLVGLFGPRPRAPRGRCSALSWGPRPRRRAPVRGRT